MTTEAILMMILAMLVIWGGLVAAVVNLQRSDHQLADPAADDVRRDL